MERAATRAPRGRCLGTPWLPFYATATSFALFGVTHLAGNTLPWLALGESRQVGDELVFVNAPRDLGEKLFNTSWW